MEELIILAQLTLALSVAYVWVFRFHNVLKEFKSFGLNGIILPLSVKREDFKFIF